MEVRQNEVIWTVEVATQGLEKVLKLPAQATKLTESQLQAMKSEIVAYLLESLKVEINGAPVEAEPGALGPVYDTLVGSGEKYIAYARQQFRFPSTTEVKRVTLSAALFLTVTSQHHAALTVSWNGAQRPFSRYGPFDLELTAARVNPKWWNTAGEFVVWGMRHIFIGYDHIAFLLGLLLAARRLREMVKVVTSFTLAHSLTLLLASLDVIRLPQGLTESLIAASIVYVAAENYFLKEGRYRWILSFGFGLVHGLGFSSVLRERLQDLQSILVPVVSFNVGVELGQLVILLIALPVLVLIRRGPDEAATERHQRWLIRVGSMPILLLGSFWLIDRAFQLNLMPF
ncbi:MAG TPA: HupE/UreJ family protein [Methylomirabilota bacterium]|nr:HupE/UreJ family protein [Methylomirabilota bacterium]